jgi:hypothetical protein
MPLPPGPGTHTYFGTRFRVSESHAFCRNRARSGETGQECPAGGGGIRTVYVIRRRIAHAIESLFANNSLARSPVDAFALSG